VLAAGWLAGWLSAGKQNWLWVGLALRALRLAAVLKFVRGLA